MRLVARPRGTSSLRRPVERITCPSQSPQHRTAEQHRQPRRQRERPRHGPRRGAEVTPAPARRGPVEDDEGRGRSEEECEVQPPQPVDPECAPGKRRGHDEEREGEGERVGEVAAEVDEGLELDGRAPGTAQHTREQLARGLHAALRPPPLLDQERGRGGGKLRGHADIVPEHEAPPCHLGAVADVEVFGEGVRLPSPGVGQGPAAPQPGGPVEVEEASAAVAPALFQEEVPVEEERLGAGQPGVLLVQVVPAGLHHPHPRVGHRGQQRLEEAGAGHEVGVEDEDVLAGRRFEARREGARLVAGPAPTVVHRDVDAGAAPHPGSPAREEGRFVGGVVQDLDLEVGGGVGEAAGRVDEALDDVLLVVDGELHGDAGWVGRGGGCAAAWPVERPAAASPREPQQSQPVARERHQQREHDRVQRHRGDAQEFGHRRPPRLLRPTRMIRRPLLDTFMTPPRSVRGAQTWVESR